MTTPRTTYTFNLTAEQQEILIELLKTGNYKPVQVQYAIIAVDAELWNCRVVLYTSGKCLVQGRGAEDFATNILEPLVLKQAVIGYEEILDPELVSPHMGIDESGKGDFFGPLVIAAAYVNENIYAQLKKINVRDSKTIQSGKQISAMASSIRRILGKNRYTIVKIGNVPYNKLYLKMQNVNRILAWGHARCIENLLSTIPSCPMAISDQFGNKESIEHALMYKGRNIELIQRHKAESDIAVAAASILARDVFIQSLQDMEKQYGSAFLKGASAQVRETAEKLVKEKGCQVLAEVSKCHFRTLDLVLEATGHTRSEMPPEGQVLSNDSSKSNFKNPAKI